MTNQPIRGSVNPIVPWNNQGVPPVADPLYFPAKIVHTPKNVPITTTVMSNPVLNVPMASSNYSNPVIPPGKSVQVIGPGPKVYALIQNNGSNPVWIQAGQSQNSAVGIQLAAGVIREYQWITPPNYSPIYVYNPGTTPVTLGIEIGSVVNAAPTVTIQSSSTVNTPAPSSPSAPGTAPGTAPATSPSASVTSAPVTGYSGGNPSAPVDTTYSPYQGGVSSPFKRELF